MHGFLLNEAPLWSEHHLLDGASLNEEGTIELQTPALSLTIQK